jgi:hypothetical protein
VIVSTKSNGAFNKGRTGASQQFSNREITAVPITGSRSISSVTKYNANAGSGGSFGGQDSRLNNFTIDGFLIMVSDLVMTHKQEVELVLQLFH